MEPVTSEGRGESQQFGVSRWLPPLVMQSRPAVRYAIAFVAVGLAALVQRSIFPQPSIAPFVFFYSAIALTALLGGRGPGLLSVALAASTANYLFLVPYGAVSLSVPALRATTLFLISGSFVATLCGSFSTLLVGLRATVEQSARVQADLWESQRLLESERQRLRGVLEGIADEVWVSDADGRTTLVNANASRRSWVSDGDVETLGPDEKPRVDPAAEPLARSLRGEVLRGEEIQRRRSTGETRHRQFSSSPTRDASGTITGAVAVVRDVTESKRFEQALLQSENRYRSLFDNQPLAVAHCRMILDEAGRPADFVAIKVNRAFQTHTGLTDVEGYPVNTVIEGFAVEAKDTLERLGRVASTGEADRFEAFVPPMDAWFAVSAYRPAPGEFVAVFENITERKNAERERERLMEALRESDRRKDDFLGMLSHELRNPLAPIRSCLEVLNRAQPGSEQASRAGAVITRQVAHLNRIVEDLLDVNRVTRGLVVPRREPTNLSELVHVTCEDHRAVFDDKGVGLECRVSEPVWVDGDAARLSQAIGNLLLNAMKFTPRGGRASVSVERENDQAVIRVGDDGVGIPRETLATLFEPFAQADRTLDRAAGGLGLGLSVVKGIVELHGGTVMASSEGDGKGAVFTVRLPTIAPSRSSAAVAADQPPAPQRILIIEDNADAANSLKEALEMDSHQVEVAYTGRSGLEKIRTLVPDIVLCDIGLPEMDGYEIAKAVREDEQLRAVRLVAVTGYAAEEHCRKAKESGFDRHIPKPATLVAVEEAITSLSHRDAA